MREGKGRGRWKGKERGKEKEGTNMIATVKSGIAAISTFVLASSFSLLLKGRGWFVGTLGMLQMNIYLTFPRAQSLLQ